ncbi:deoxyribodipyrimidine photolyase [Thioflavicoccus mobilis 8321]|uniref:Deoxyribodipyrimidine photo-lyase n=1 Tax=Thioflavicoccus mobilis 8321 TaxID=765912 RepID=L0H0K8_9GAMM|nr:deoxyribodipyrimidine photo-lyase [Thioflavicoccus mobilis]AGA91170.1 deoxyribodipyrimidine photolyase [Thioflavicoccus mobilis 8321]
MVDTVILWLRRDLRLADNPALSRALSGAGRLVPLYIHCPAEEGRWRAGAASRWWLHHSLAALDRAFRERGSRLLIARGEDSLTELRRIATACGATRICWARRYEPATRATDARTELALRADGLRCDSVEGNLLFEPWDLATEANGPYRVFSAYWRRAVTRLTLPVIEPAPTALPPAPSDLGALSVDELGLLPRVRWDTGLAHAWTPGEDGAQARASAFIDGPLATYAAKRDRPGVLGTSRLSPHLHFGEIGPRQLVRMIADRGLVLDEGPAEPYVRELGWREFAYHLIHHFPHTTDEPLDERFAAFPWREDETLLAAWQRGRTGIPLIDAGLRELWKTGWMHNRVRMAAASLLTKNLRQPWQAGARWFWDTLVDADLASNTLGWQWTAGCGADAAPYFRIFNPVRQGERFDPTGDYVRRWCPELARLPARFIHQPWAAPAGVLTDAGIRLGSDYPQPIVDLAASRREALAAWETIKNQA